MKRTLILAALLLAALTPWSNALANPVVGQGWLSFSWDAGVGSVSGPFDFTTSGPTVLKVTDLYIDGDQFAVYDNGSLLGDTSVPANDGAYTGDPDFAYSDPRWSHGFWDLGIGAHSLTFNIIATAACCATGGADFRVDPASVPEPGALGTFGLGLFAIGAIGLMRRRFNAQPRAN